MGKSQYKSEACYKNGKTACIYAGIAAFCGLFAFIYQQFSHGVHSAYMTWTFLAPLVLGTVVFGIFFLCKRTWDNIGRTIYHSGIATLTVGCLVRGGLDIYGTNSRLVKIYFIAAPILLLIGVILGTVLAIRDRKKSVQ